MPQPQLEWKRKQLRGTSAKKRKEWYDADKQYRIVWQAECAGVNLSEHYGALYQANRVERFESGMGWARLTNGPPKFYRTLKTAQRACNAHKFPGSVQPKKKRKRRRK
jgi:hypothetical protein